MNYDDVTPDTRIILTAHGNKGTVLRKFMGGPNQDLPVIVINFDGAGITMRTPDQLTPIDEPAPAPKLRRSTQKGASEFYLGGELYSVTNGVSNTHPVNGYWMVTRVTGTYANEAYIVTGAKTKKAAFEQAVATLTAA